MRSVFKRELKANLKGLLIWSAVMAVMALLGFGEYGVIMGESAAMNMDGMVQMMPRIVQIMMGMGKLPINTPEGWYVCMYLWCAVIAYLYAAMLGADILSKEESDKTSGFLFTKPITRSAAITGKALAAVLYVFVIALVCWGATAVIFVPYVTDSALITHIAWTMLVGMPLTALIFLFAGLCLSAVLTGRGKALQGSAAVLVAAYGIFVAVEVADRGGYWYILSPFCYFEPVRLMADGFNPLYVALSVGWIALTAWGTYFFYKRRNLHS